MHWQRSSLDDYAGSLQKQQPLLSIFYTGNNNSKNTQNNSYVEIVQFDRKHEKTMIGWWNHQKEFLCIYMMQARIISCFFHGGFHVSHYPIYRVLTVLSLVKEVYGNPFLSKYHHQGDNFPEKSGSHSRFFVRIKNGSKTGGEEFMRTSIRKVVRIYSCTWSKKKKIVFF